MIKFRTEKMLDALVEIKELLPFHYEELALHKDKVPLDPQYDTYLKKENDGTLLLVCARDEGKLIGYYTGFIAPGLHYNTCLTCHQDIFFILKEYRNAGIGLWLFTYVENELRDRGVQRWYMGSKAHSDVTPLFKKIGAEIAEVCYSKWIGE